MSEKINLEGLPDECSLMTVVNTWGLVVVGGNNGAHHLFGKPASY